MKLFCKPWFWCVGAGLAVLALIWAAYRFNWPGTGFHGKTIWDWLQLLIIPLALASVALFFNQANTRTERGIAQKRYEQDKEIALDKQREDLLQAYLDRMSELLLEKGLRTSPTDAEVRNVARVRTISILRQLDVRRVGDVFAFLHEAGLTNLSDPVVSLKHADLSKVKWGGADLNEANLSNAFLRGADLNNANLHKANLSNAFLHRVSLNRAILDEANLDGAILSNAFLHEAYLHEAVLRGANLSGADLKGADFNGAKLKGADFSRTKLKDAKIDKSQLTPEQIAQAIWD